MIRLINFKNLSNGISTKISNRNLSQSIINSSSKRFTPQQKMLLEKAFEENPYPENKKLKNFAEDFDKTTTQVRSWFTKQRSKLKEQIGKDEFEKMVSEGKSQKLVKNTKNRDLAETHNYHMVFTTEQICIMEKSFEENMYPTPKEMQNFANDFDVTKIQVRNGS